MKRKIIVLSFSVFTFLTNAQEISLSQAKKYALENNNSIKNSNIEITSAENTKRNARTNYFPKINIVGLVAKSFDPLVDISTDAMNLPVYNGNPSQLPLATQFAYVPPINLSINQMAFASATLLQPIFLGNKINIGNKLATLNLEAKVLQKELTEKEILFKTEQQYRTVLVLMEKEKTLSAYENFLEKLLQDVNNAVNSGLAIDNDLLKVRIKQSELKLKRIELEKGIELATKQLCQTIGVEYQPSLQLSHDEVILNNPTSLQIDSKTALSSRQEYQLLEKSVEASQLETKMKKASNLPSVVAGISGFYMDTMDKSFDGKINGVVFGGVNIPISGWWENRHAINKQKNKEQIALNQLNENKELLQLQIDKAWTDLNIAYENISLSQEIIEQTKENLRINLLGYHNGITPLSEVLEAQAQVNQAEERLIDAKHKYQNNVNQYIKVTGR